MLAVLDIDTSNQEQAAKEVCAVLEIAVDRARREIRSKLVPHLYQSGVKYAKQNPSACAFRTPLDVFKRKQGDCKQLVLWRIAELREAGEDAKPRIMWIADKKGLRAHAQVRRGNGTIEDPSALLGMRSP